jgi:hypothetical protein
MGESLRNLTLPANLNLSVGDERPNQHKQAAKALQKGGSSIILELEPAIL